MINIDRIFIIQILLLLVCLINPAVKAQTSLGLPGKIQLIVNGSEIIPTQSWVDSLVDEANNRKIFYKIISAFRANFSVTTQIQIPQIFSLNEVYRQIVLYYSFIQDEEMREKEFLTVYPYFASTEEDPAIRCQYISEGKYEIEIEYWLQVPIPDKPRVEDRNIFNQILQISFHEVQSMGDVSDDVFEKVAEKNKTSIQRVKTIYQNSILWQLAIQMYSQ
jgi:hypothetical protein